MGLGIRMRTTDLICNMCLLLFVIIFCWSFNTVFTENTNLNAIPYSLFHFSIIPILIPNTPYSTNPKASYVEQAMTGFLLGDGVLVKKYKRQRRVEELILNSLKVKFCLRP